MGIIIVEQSKTSRMDTIYKVVNNNTANIIGGIEVSRVKAEELADIADKIYIGCGRIALSDKVIGNILCEKTKVYLSSDVGSINIKKNKNELEIGTRFTYKDCEYKESSSKAVLMAVKDFDTKCRVRSMSYIIRGGNAVNIEDM